MESIASIGVRIDDDDKVEVCLCGIGPSYKAFKMLEHIPNLTNLVCVLIIEEKNLGENLPIGYVLGVFLKNIHPASQNIRQFFFYRKYSPNFGHFRECFENIHPIFYSYRFIYEKYLQTHIHTDS